MSLKLISLNIEANNHLDIILPWLQQEKPDVVCLQEVFAIDWPRFQQTLGMKGKLLPLLNIAVVNDYRLQPKGLFGIAILTNLPHGDFHSEFYFRHGPGLPELVNGDPNSGDRAMLWSTIVKDGQEFTVANTHFTWSPAGSLIPLQESTYETMLSILTKIPEFILCGDFNSPRGKGGIFDRLSARYTDNIPLQITTTIDGRIHRAGQLDLVVDGLFSTSKYSVNQVSLVSGLSDHQAVVSQISLR